MILYSKLKSSISGPGYIAQYPREVNPGRFGIWNMISICQRVENHAAQHKIRVPSIDYEYWKDKLPISWKSKCSKQL